MIIHDDDLPKRNRRESNIHQSIDHARKHQDQAEMERDELQRCVNRCLRLCDEGKFDELRVELFEHRTFGDGE